MYRRKSGSKPLDDDDQSSAFEFVVGTLRGTERIAFKKVLKSDESLQRVVSFWEEQFEGLQKTNDVLPPKADTWATIENIVGGTHEDESTLSQNTVTQGAISNMRLLWKLIPWGLTAILSVALFFNIVIAKYPAKDAPVDYVAVLTNTEGDAQLTALTTNQSQTMWLTWEVIDFDKDKDMQLWAISRQDGQARSLAVIEQIGAKKLSLSEAHWRLVKDADYLILTEEEQGGSPLDEPSDIILAKGVCVRFQSNSESS